MKEEDVILRKAGTKNCFNTPEGYFDNLTSEIMDKLPEKEDSFVEAREVTLWDRIKPWTYMAAMFVGAALIIRVASSNRSTETDALTAVEETEMQGLSDEDINIALDKSMMDDYALYVYLSEANEE